MGLNFYSMFKCVCFCVFKNNGKFYYNCIGDINIWDIFGGEDVVCFIFSDLMSRWINIDIFYLLVFIKMFCMKFRILEIYKMKLFVSFVFINGSWGICIFCDV